MTQRPKHRPPAQFRVLEEIVSMPIMRRTVLAAAMAISLGYTANALSSDSVRQLMTQQGCFSCHAMNHMKTGPAYSWVSYHNQGRRGAVGRLAQKIVQGGTGYWSPWTYGTPMPPHPELRLDQAKSMARWVLARTPQPPPQP